MARDLPYFKFYSSEWNDGDITLEDYHTQGVFINICSYYWSRECNLQKVKLYKRFRDCKGALDFLFESLLLDESKGFIKIKFLDRQWTERENKKATMKANGLKGGRPKKNQKLSNEETKSSPSANQNITNKEERREEEKRKELKSKPKKEALAVSISINPEETAKPKPTAFYKFGEIFPKRFDLSCPKIKSAFFQAVSVADGEDVILVAASMYAEYFQKTSQPLQYASPAEKWLNSKSWLTDWNAEIDKHNNQGKKAPSTSRVSDIKADEVF